MKKVFLSIAAIAALVALPMSVSAQNFVNTNVSNDENSSVKDVDASAKIITPIKIELVSGTLDFGTIVSPPANDEVTIAPDGTRSANDEEILISTTETGGVPTFKVTGQLNYAYSLSLPKNTDNIKLSAGGIDLVVKDFTSNLAANPTIQAGGTEFQVGATVEVPKNVAPNTYEGKFDVTVAYN